MEFSGKTILITGASSGLGKALVERFLQEGAQVFGIGRRKETGISHPAF